MAEDRIILGIDPGTTVLGYGLIHVKNGKISLLNFGIVQLHKLPSHPDKLKRILERLNGLIEEYKPDEMAIEAPFFGKNVQSMLKLGRVQGMVMSLAFSKSIPISEYEPKKIKQSVTGNGNSSKEQVAKMVEVIGNIKLDAKLFDATDALGIAICHHFHNNNITSTIKGTKKGWGAFVNENPARVK